LNLWNPIKGRLFTGLLGIKKNDLNSGDVSFN